mgnify:CR=1 FL=1
MLIKNWKKEILTIPNLLSLFRIALIPVYLYIYLHADSPDDYTLAAVILAASCLTDMVDGKIARKFNMITNLGKVLDPMADKLTQLGLMICLSFERRAIRLLLLLFLIKEFFQFFAMVGSLRRGKALDGALMSGKVSTTVLFGSLGLMVLCPRLSNRTVNWITGISLVFLMAAFFDYVRAYFGKNKKIYDLE